MNKRRAKNTGVLILVAVVALILSIWPVAATPLSDGLSNVIRVAALLGYLGVFLAIVSSHYMRELTRYFGRSFIKVHHMVSIVALAAMWIHALGVAWNVRSLGAFLPNFTSLHTFLLLGGRPALWLILVATLAALWRGRMRKNWRTIHWLNYVAFFLASAHAILIGSDFRALGMQVLAIVLSLIVVGVFVLKRRPRKPRAS